MSKVIERMPSRDGGLPNPKKNEMCVGSNMRIGPYRKGYARQHNILKQKTHVVVLQPQREVEVISG